MGETNAELVRRGYEAALRGHLDEIAGLLAPDVKWHGGDPSVPEACHNRDEALEFIGRARRRGAIGELVEVVEAGERVVVIIRPGRGTRLAGNVTTFRSGKVVEMVHYPSSEEARAAAGV